MPVTPATPLKIAERHDASGSIESQGDVFGRKFSDTFYYFFARDVSQPRVLVSVGFLPNQAHPDDDRAYVNSITAASPLPVAMEDGTPAYQWTVTIGYATVTGNQVVGGPLAQPAKVTRKQTAKEGIATTTHDGEPILNTAGDPYSPPIPKDTFESKFRIEKNLASFNFFTLDALVGKTNDAPWRGFPARTLRVEPFDVPEKQHDDSSGADYYPMAIELSYNPDTWTAKVPNVGFRELKDGKLVRIMDDKGEERDEPTLLDEDGKALAYPADSNSIVFGVFEIYEPTSFAPLDVFGNLPL